MVGNTQERSLIWINVAPAFCGKPGCQ
jgi:hypothetical protein